MKTEQPAIKPGHTFPLIALATFAFRRCLTVFPRPFQRAFGDEMLDVFRHASMQARAEGGIARLLGYWWTAFADLFRSALVERRSQPANRPAPPKDDRNMFDDLRQDLRYAVRSMLQGRSLTVAALLSLALGIGANVAIYSIVDAVLLRPLPLREPDRLVAPGTDIVTYPAYRDFRDRARSFEGLAASDTRGRRLVMRDGNDVSVISGVLVSGNYFSVLGVEPHLGRALTPADDKPGAGAIVVISYNLWHRDFAADPLVLGKHVSVNGYPLTVVGVAPAGFRGERLNDVKEAWIPLAMHPLLTPGGEADLENRDAWGIRMMGRLAPGVAPGQALDELNAIGARLAEEHPATDGEWAFDELLPAPTIATISRREELTRFMWLLAGTVGAALLIACANVGNLLLLRGEQRRDEIDMRRALGATRARLVRQLLTESLILALLGGALGMAVAAATLAALQRFELPGNIVIAALEIGLQRSTLLLALGISLMTSLVFGSLPALQGSRSIGTRAHPSWRRFTGARARGVFVAVQVALSLVLVAGGGLFVRSLVNAITSDVGFNAGGLLIADVNLDGQDFRSARAEAFFGAIEERLGALPGVESLSWSNAVPVESRGYVEDVIVEGFEPTGDDGRVQSIHLNMVSSRFFDTVGIPLLRGRSLDARPGSREVVVNEAMATRYWPGQNPLGKRLALGATGAYEVVGVAANTTLRRLGEESFPYVFAPFFFDGSVGSPRLALRGRPGPGGNVDKAQLAGVLRRTFEEINASVPVTNLRTWSEHTGEQTRTQQLGATLLGFFSLVALTLAAVGIYGVMSFSVSRRTRELGIRAALGARHRDLMRLALRSATATLLAGVLAGALLTLAAGSSVEAFLFGVEPYDPATLAGAVVVLLAIGFGAAWMPARRAAMVDPVIAFRTR